MLGISLVILQNYRVHRSCISLRSAWSPESRLYLSCFYNLKAQLFLALLLPARAITGLTLHHQLKSPQHQPISSTDIAHSAVLKRLQYVIKENSTQDPWSILRSTLILFRPALEDRRKIHDYRT